MQLHKYMRSGRCFCVSVYLQLSVTNCTPPLCHLATYLSKLCDLSLPPNPIKPLAQQAHAQFDVAGAQQHAGELLVETCKHTE